MSKSKKIERPFQLSDSSVNCYGFRLLTSGYDIDRFKKNPIGYYMHFRGDGVVVKWEDLKIEGDAIVGTPVINMSNTRGQQTVDEIENGFLNAASVGHIVALEYSDDPSMKLPGQTGVTVTKWYNKECSVVDIPGNEDSLALYDEDGQIIKLFHNLNTQKTSPNMKQVILTAGALAVLNLKDDATSAVVDQTINDLVAKGNLSDQLKTERDTALGEVKKLKDAATEKSINDLVDGAHVAKKITADQVPEYKSLAAGNFEAVKKILDAASPYQSIEKSLADGKEVNAVELAQLIAKSGNELFLESRLDRLKELSEEHYIIKYKECFGKEPVKAA